MMPDADYGGGNYNSGLGSASGNWGSTTDAGASGGVDTSGISGLGGSLGGTADDGGYGASTSSPDTSNNGFNGFDGGGYAGDSTSESYGDPGISGGISSLGAPSTDSTSNGLTGWGGFDLRGPTGPEGEPRSQPSAYGTNYQTAQMMRGLYDNIGRNYTDPGLAATLNKFSQAIPGEAAVNQYGLAGTMQNIGRVGLNQMIRNISGQQMLTNMDTTGMRPGTAHLAAPSQQSMGMQPIDGPLQTLASGALQNALLGQGITPEARNATNFTGAGATIDGVQPIGQPVNGTQYFNDPGAGNSVARRNSIAQQVLDGIMGEQAAGLTGLPSGWNAQPMGMDIDPNDLTDPTMPDRTYPSGAPMPQQNPYSDQTKFSFPDSGIGRPELQDVDPRVLGMTVDLQSQYGKPIGITEGSAASGHATHSQHYGGQALDLKVPSGDRADIVNMASDVGFGGIGAYNSLPQQVHVDGRPMSAAQGWGPKGTIRNLSQIQDPNLRQAIAAHDAKGQGGTWSQIAKAGSAVADYGKQFADRAKQDIMNNQFKIGMMTLGNLYGANGTQMPGHTSQNGQSDPVPLTRVAQDRDRGPDPFLPTDVWLRRMGIKT